jgi:hypothetical protein
LWPRFTGIAGLQRIEVPEVAMAHARFSRHSLVEQFMNGRMEFTRLGAWETGWPELLAGDLLGFRMGRVIHHLGIRMAGQASKCSFTQLSVRA